LRVGIRCGQVLRVILRCRRRTGRLGFKIQSQQGQRQVKGESPFEEQVASQIERVDLDVRSNDHCVSSPTHPVRLGAVWEAM